MPKLTAPKAKKKLPIHAEKAKNIDNRTMRHPRHPHVDAKEEKSDTRPKREEKREDKRARGGRAHRGADVISWSTYFTDLHTCTQTHTYSRARLKAYVLFLSASGVKFFFFAKNGGCRLFVCVSKHCVEWLSFRAVAFWCLMIKKRGFPFFFVRARLE